MKSLNCAVVDDEPLALELMESYVNQTPFLNLIKCCSRASELFELVNEENVDLIFMDIHMPDINGLELSKIIDKNIMLIFVTAYDQYAVESYKVNAVDYLLKPVSYAEFLSAANKALNLADLRSSFQRADIANDDSGECNSIFVKSDYKLLQIKVKDVLYVEGLKDYIKIYIENEINPIVSLVSMKSIEEALPTEKFMRVHRSYIVNMSKVKIVDRSRIVFGKVYIPISDSYKEKFNEFVGLKIVK